MTRRHIAWLFDIILIALWVYAVWLYLRPAPVSMLGTLSGYICTPSRSQWVPSSEPQDQPDYPPLQPEPVYPPEFERGPLAGAGEWEAEKWAWFKNPRFRVTHGISARTLIGPALKRVYATPG